ncbi:YybH family protein [Roseobacter ponti]|uniref:Nuclear transport factor 2 family protein n=1 Tax=Roseobacter ponti TaxID=1891787 RepID=A0A858SSF3_9RHOB|nr:nuclear transport factor 2 family protein [Roseobacter ponti]QJF50531.1 nuclear transport factor 2 family protein [Roseobacter ponti]
MSLPEPLSFARDWQAAWNSHDLDRVLARYTDDIRFRSSKAQTLVGRGLIEGKDALRDYWRQALEAQPTLAFRVQDVFGGYQMIVITYLNHRDVLAAETLYFNEEGLVYRAAASHRDI